MARAGRKHPRGEGHAAIDAPDIVAADGDFKMPRGQVRRSEDSAKHLLPAFGFPMERYAKLRIAFAAGTTLYRRSSCSSAPRIQPDATQTAEDRAKNRPQDDAEEGIADDHEAASFEVALASYLGSACLMASHDATYPAPDDSAESQTDHEEANDDAPPLHAAPLRFTGSWSLCLLLQRSHLSPTMGLAAAGEQTESHPFRVAKLLILQVG
jgi:hypothetical protein